MGSFSKLENPKLSVSHCRIELCNVTDLLELGLWIFYGVVKA